MVAIRGKGLAVMLRSIFILAVMASLAAGSAARADRVNITDCKGFEAEKVALDKTGIAEDVAKGPEWGKANLSPERLRNVGRYIFLEEQLTFRCPDVFATAAVRQMEEQARLKALAALERARLWEESMKKVVPPVKKPKTELARNVAVSGGEAIPPLPVRKSR